MSILANLRAVKVIASVIARAQTSRVSDERPTAFCFGHPRIFWITGPPASGKSTLCAELAGRMARAIHIPVDDLRTWVVSGLAESVPWTEETERQFQVAEHAVCRVAQTYWAAGFDVLVDHCRNPQRLQRLIQERLPKLPLVKVCLLPELAVNLERSHSRTNKTFDPHMLDETILFTNDRYRSGVPDGWLVIDNTCMTVQETAERVLAWPPGGFC